MICMQHYMSNIDRALHACEGKDTGDYYKI